MKLTIYVVLATTMVLLSSCLNVFQPIIPAEKYIQDKRIEGNWKMKDVKINISEYSKSPLASEKKYPMGSTEKKSKKEIQDSISLFHKSYILSFSDEKYSYYYHLQMMIRENTQFVQLYPIVFSRTGAGEKIFDEENLPESRFNAFGTEGIMSTFSFGRLKIIDNNQLEFQFIDGEKIKALILAGNMKTRYAFDRLYDNFLITATTNELEKLVGKYGNNDELYSKVNSYTFAKTQ